ncbi:unnamed protein product [Staurois parvus]|uniref:Uncharacterized protein n=1 Tax=Staurois parvus TaxID=386267 RepID=A0ABN9CZ57_9NEOB|nr:unnamed protein product [Staurois parvus]
MPASVFRVPFPATSGHTGTELVGNLKILIKSHSKTLLYQTISHTFCP